MRSVLLVVLAACGRLGFGDRAGRDGGDGADASTDLPDAPPVSPNVAFVTTMKTDGNFGGLAGADALCAMEATAAGLPGEFVALLWAGGVDPGARLAGATGWVDVTGRPIAEQPSDFTSGLTIYPLQYDADGTLVRGGGSWLGNATENCTDWTDGTGVVGINAVSITDQTIATQTFGACSSPQGLICLERARAAHVAPPAQGGRFAFVSEAEWRPGGGLADADATCQAEAVAAGLPGTFLAMLPTGTGGAETRFDLGGAPWCRVDGVRLTPTAADWFSGPAYFDTFLARTARGLPSISRPWTGVGAAGTCNAWTSSSNALSAATGMSFETTRTRFLRLFDQPCNAMAPLICLQQ